MGFKAWFCYKKDGLGGGGDLKKLENKETLFFVQKEDLSQPETHTRWSINQIVAHYVGILSNFFMNYVYDSLKLAPLKCSKSK